MLGSLFLFVDMALFVKAMDIQNSLKVGIGLYCKWKNSSVLD